MKKIYLIAALAMGLTAVACNSQTAEENAESCAKKLVEAVRQNALENLGKAAGEKVYYSWSQAVDKAWTRYEKVLQSRKR